jgi:hypothetical protein
MGSPKTRLRPITAHGWLSVVLSLGSMALLITGAILVAKGEYLLGIGGLVAGVFAAALIEILLVLHQLYRRVAEVETSSRERVAEAEARILARIAARHEPEPPHDPPS